MLSYTFQIFTLFHLFAATFANDPLPTAQIGGPIANRIAAIRMGLIHTLSTMPTTDADDGNQFSFKMPLDSSQSNLSVTKLHQKCLIGTETRQFEFISYFVNAFKELMNVWQASDEQQLLNSLKIGELHTISNPNGRLSTMDIFIKTADQRFFIKDVKTGMEMMTIGERRKAKAQIGKRPKAEIDFFEKHFSAYCTRMAEERISFGHQSLLPKFFALFGIKDNSYGVEGEQRMFLVTKNLFPEHFNENIKADEQIALNFAYKFDIKGSLDHQKLSAKKRQSENSKNPTFRYLDLYDEAEKQLSAVNQIKLAESNEGCFFRDGILLEDSKYKKFIEILERDAWFLMKSGRTDYSLLLGVTFEELSELQMELLKKENSNILEASCTNCSRNIGQTYLPRIDNFIIIPGIIDTLAQFNWRKTIDMVKRVVVKHETEKKAKSAIGAEDFYFRFMCAISTKVFRPRYNREKLLETNEDSFCKWEISEPKI